jgi:hypothetical protein
VSQDRTTIRACAERLVSLHGKVVAALILTESHGFCRTDHRTGRSPEDTCREGDRSPGEITT